ncbi:hypothetical protein [Flexithrix dorotheae]|uniref:hypothetical protein n=1 Tax=Flexithrix dorotheae TaxID=70993 RepID=UPI0003758830|nr:hypothetical protein [Flexithrix dorotheae]
MRKKGLPVTFIILAVIIAYLLYNQTGGPGNLEEAISNLKQDSTFVKIDSIVEKAIPQKRIEDTKDSLIEDSEPEIVVVDSIPVIEEDSVVEEIPVPKFYRIDVLKKDSQLMVKLNGEPTDSLITQLKNRLPDIPVVLKVAGNVTYAEGKVIKDQLEQEGIKFQEID